jgi:hypothetical protein
MAGLLDGDGEAYLACRRALRAGADFSIDQKPLPLAGLIPTFGVREAITRERGIPTLGFADALRTLRAAEPDDVVLASVTQHEPPYRFLVFLAVDRSHVVACLGVGQGPTGRPPVPARRFQR